MFLAPTNFTADIDAAVRRLERAGGLDLATLEHGVSPELLRASQRRARDLRAAAFNAALRALCAAPRRFFAALRGRPARESTVSTVG